jgi:hypothetical protein
MGLEITDFNFNPEPPVVPENTGAASPEVPETPAQEPAQPATGSEGEPPAPASEPAPQPSKDYAWLKEVSEGAVEDPDSLKQLVKEYKELKESPRQPQFSNEAQQRIYEFASKFDGNNMEAARTYLHAQSLDTSALDGKTTMLEAFLLENPELSRSQGQEIFEDLYAKKYSDDPEEMSAAEKWEYQKEVNKAKESISKIQGEFKTALQTQGPDETKLAEAKEKMNQDIDAALKGFSGIQQVFDFENDQVVVKEGSSDDAFKYSTTPEIQKSLEAAMKNSEEFYSQRYSGKEGLQKYRDDMFWLMNKDAIIKDIFGHGYQKGKLAEDARIKNIPSEKLLPGQRERGLEPETLVGSIRRAKSA